jgi:tRNA threonylcarbamoyladenosine biosynthesis protein TsaE
VAPSAADPVKAMAVEVATPAEMRALGQRIARLLRAGDLVLLSGELGAGKTTLAQGIGTGLAVRGPITSPTFVLARLHPSLHGGAPLVHVDAYRLVSWDELEGLDLEATLDDAVTVVEWGEGLFEGLSTDRLEVRIHRRPGGRTGGVETGENDVRKVEIVPIGRRWAGVTVPGEQP